MSLDKTIREQIALDQQCAARERTTWSAETCARRVLETVTRLALEREHIAVLLEATFEAAIALAIAEGERRGRDAVLNDHPALREFGKAVAAAVSADRIARTETARAIIEASVKMGNNSWKAAYDAIDALSAATPTA